MRSALGGASIRLFRQLAIESTTLTVTPGIIGAAAAAGLIPVLKALAPPGIPRFDSVALDARVLGWY